MHRVFALAVVATCSRAPTQAVSWIEGDEPAAFAQARARHRGVLINFDATWSVPSAELTRNLGDPAIAGQITDNFVPLHVDVSNDTEAVAAIRTRYHVQALPMIVLVAEDGTVVGRFDRLLDVVALSHALEPAIAGLHRR